MRKQTGTQFPLLNHDHNFNAPTLTSQLRQIKRRYITSPTHIQRLRKEWVKNMWKNKEAKQNFETHSAIHAADWVDSLQHLRIVEKRLLKGEANLIKIVQLPNKSLAAIKILEDGDLIKHLMDKSYSVEQIAPIIGFRNTLADTREQYEYCERNLIRLTRYLESLNNLDNLLTNIMSPPRRKLLQDTHTNIRGLQIPHVTLILKKHHTN